MSKSSTPQPRMGSIKNKIVSSDLEEERKHCNFDNKELAKLIWNGEQDYIRVKDIWADLQADKGLQSSEKFYDMSREEQMEDALRRLRRYYDLHREKYFDGFKGHYVPWWCISFQGVVSIYISGINILICYAESKCLTLFDLAAVRTQLHYVLRCV